MQTIRELYIELREVAKLGEKLVRYANGELADEAYTNAKGEAEVRKRLVAEGAQQRVRVRHAQAVLRITVGSENSLIRISYAIRATFDAMLLTDALSDAEEQWKRLSYVEYCMRKYEGAAQVVYGTDRLIAKMPVPEVDLLSLESVAGLEETKVRATTSSLEPDFQKSLPSALPRGKAASQLVAETPPVKRKHVPGV